MASLFLEQAGHLSPHASGAVRRWQTAQLPLHRRAIRGSPNDIACPSSCRTSREDTSLMTLLRKGNDGCGHTYEANFGFHANRSFPSTSISDETRPSSAFIRAAIVAEDAYGLSTGSLRGRRRIYRSLGSFLEAAMQDCAAQAAVNLQTSDACIMRPVRLGI